jgi:hypothetical protein
LVIVACYLPWSLLLAACLGCCYSLLALCCFCLPCIVVACALCYVAYDSSLPCIVDLYLGIHLTFLSVVVVRFLPCVAIVYFSPCVATAYSSPCVIVAIVYSLSYVIVVTCWGVVLSPFSTMCKLELGVQVKKNEKRLVFF